MVVTVVVSAKVVGMRVGRDGVPVHGVGDCGGTLSVLVRIYWRFVGREFAGVVVGAAWVKKWGCKQLLHP